MLERGGDVVVQVVTNVSKGTQYTVTAENAEPDSTVHTDEFGTYTGLDRDGYAHDAVSHELGEYVNGDCHVNGLEGFGRP